MRATTFAKGKQAGTWQHGEFPALAIRGKIGHSNGYGFITCGGGQFGDSSTFTGIYQVRRAGYNNQTGPSRVGARRYLVVMRDYGPTYRNTEAQQKWRGKLGDAVRAWRELTAEEKSRYNAKASKLGRKGYHLFLTQHMKAQP